MPNCRNCEQSTTTDIKFCPHCGQKNTDGKIRVWNFLAVFINEVFDIESKLFKTMRDLFIPGKLTIEYFKGKHKTYFHPLRFFMVLAILLLALISFFSDDLSSDFDDPSFKEKVYYSVLFKQLDSLNNANYQTKQYDSLTHAQIYQLVCNTLGEYEEIIPDEEKIVLDGDGKIIINMDTDDFDTDDQLSINPIDVVVLNGQEFVEKYKIEGYKNVLAIQFFKLLKSGGTGLIDFIYSNVIWAGLLMMPFLALILKLFFFKQKRYFVEHLVFCFHTHSYIFLLFTLGLLIEHFLNLNLILILLFLIVPLYIIFSIKKVYGQRWSMTLLKFAGISFFYTILSSMFLALTLVLGFLFF